VPVLLGTSGWSYDEWDGVVYPRAVEPGDRLRWYATQFPTVEIDSTYYRDPAPGTVRGWARKVAGSPGFELSAKAPQSLTHEAMVDEPPEECARIAGAWADLVARPLAEAGRLGAVLLQLSPAVVRTREALARLDATLAVLAPLDAAVEFRNRTWHDEAATRLRHDALDLLDARGAAPVVVDGPSFPTLVEGRARHAYVRFHGRNREAWFRRAEGHRYDYEYDAEELRPWVARLGALAAERAVVRAYFNNHVEGHAFHDASSLSRMLDEASVPQAHARSPQRKLF
jgi:uncharacterized protein YecE (DUF72 family)